MHVPTAKTEKVSEPPKRQEPAAGEHAPQFGDNGIAGRLLRLQRTHGNRVVQRLFENDLGKGWLAKANEVDFIRLSTAPIQRDTSKCPEWHPNPDQLEVWGGNKWTPDPEDPFEQPPIDWGAFGATELDGPPAFKRALFIGPDPKPYINQCGDKWDYGLPSGSVLPQQREKADRANAAFQAAYAIVANSCEEAYPKITKFMDVTQELAGDLHFKLAFDAVPGAKDLGALTLGQTTKGVSVSDVFKGKQGTGTAANVDTSKAAMAKANAPENRQKLVEARRKVTLKNSEARTAAAHFIERVEKGKQAGDEVALAVRQVDLVKLKQGGRTLADALADLNKQKAQSAEKIETISKVITIGSKVVLAAVHPKEALEPITDAGLETLTLIVKAVDSGNMEEKVKRMDAAVREANLHIDTEEFAFAQDTLALKKKESATAVAAVPVAKVALTDALGEAQTAYNEFAELAGQFAGGSPENRKLVEAAIKAIPKVEHLVGTIAEILPSISLPSYTVDAGIGYNANLPAASETFPVHYAILKGYQKKFATQQTLWTERLKSLKAVANAFAPEPSGGAE